jgi:hypothetical protein
VAQGGGSTRYRKALSIDETSQHFFVKTGQSCLEGERDTSVSL